MLLKRRHWQRFCLFENMRKSFLLLLLLLLESGNFAQLFSFFKAEKKAAVITKIYKRPYSLKSYLNHFAESETMFQNWELNKDCVQWINKKYDSLSLDEKIGQCFMLASYTTSDKFNMDYISKMVKEGKCGGVIFFKGNPTAQANWTNQIQGMAKIPLMIAIDGEWGLSMRLDSTIVYPHQLTLGAVSDNTLIRKMGEQIGKECRRIGVNINFAPDVDINNNPNNPVINDRSFGENKFRVALKGLEYATGMQSEGVLACAKHFPGHGDTDVDSHKDLPVINKSYEQLDSLELYPFKILFAGGVGSVMAAHLQLPKLDSAKLPGSLSAQITTKLLKEKLQYKGLVFSDALNMKGAANTSVSGVVDSLAFVAGNDVLVFTENCEKGIAKIKEGILSNQIPMDMLEEKVKKILAYKYLLRIEMEPTVSTENLTDDLNCTESALIRQKLFDAAMTIAAAEDGVLPIQKNFKKIATVAIEKDNISAFQNHLETFVETDKYFFSEENEAAYNAKKDELSGYDLVVIGVHGMSRFASKNYGLATATNEFIHYLNCKTKVIVVLFGSPYSLKYFDEEKNILVAYEDNDASHLAAANAVMGGISINGKLPVSASAKYKSGNGITIEKPFRLKVATPEEAGFKTEDLREMDEVILNGLISHAFPGCQIVITKDDKVIWNKAYGTMTYMDDQKVKPNNIYDIASITKIAATTLAVMKLYENGQLDIEKTVGDYFTLDSSATILNIKIKDLLTHNAGLRPFFEHYKNTIDTNFVKYYRTSANDTFNIPVASNLFLHRDYKDSIWRRTYTSEVKPNPDYVYSDLDFYILQKIVEQISGKTLDQYIYENFYQPMGLSRMLYNPLNKFPESRIAPTEDDKVFRNQLIRGYVHDPGAAMYGGVAGHAGVFSNAFDLAQLMQMFLNKGTYNNKKFLKPTTIEMFTKQNDLKSRRGLGFDKPEPDQSKRNTTYDHVPHSVFGHTGFTGTAVWSDPENNLTFVFLSNRVNPSAENNKLVKMGIRSHLQRIIYEALEKSKLTNGQ